MNKLLEINKLSLSIVKKKGSISILKEISITLEENSIVGIVGQSGSGKSMLAKSILSLHPLGTSLKMEGSVTFEGKNLHTMKAKHLRSVRGKEIAMIFQNPMSCLNPTLKIIHQMEEIVLTHYPKYPKKLLQKQILESFISVGINNPKERLLQYPHELSGGMQQRVMIAMMMLLNPKVLIADEPTTALDVTVQAQILKLLKRLQKTTQLSILFITHDLLLAHWLCDTIYVMKEGSIVEKGSTDQIFNHPKHPYTQKLIQALPVSGIMPSPLFSPGEGFKDREKESSKSLV
ncbi:peptide ABC transporter ATP-binding protein [Candidatus Aerophobetes bacterium]|uniref:Peptide ABC transporter ATP-binding protein n=1 Tax=Aerophobetes bacterium TaxID=2030807 RepID=A0A2A4X140_UNCAE|nr:MAG: peptide ABC transporter ATP-binding protein [Candidatus Aerophobetes bacterium]